MNGPKPIWQRKFDVEQVKRDGLEADLERLEREGYVSLTPEEFYRLKTWGVCSQRTPGLHMIRIRIPGGRIGSGQLRGIAALAAELADGCAHVTTRQNLELHSVPSHRVRRALEGIARLGLGTRSTCGHTVRNIVGCTLAGICAGEAFDIRPTVAALHEFYLSRAAHYNAQLPRRLNVYVAGCADCMAHAQVNDLGFVAVRRGGEEGFQLWCAGSLASSPRLAHLLFGFVPAGEACAVAQAVTDVYCNHGFRERPAKARLKHLVAEWGLERFADAVLERLGEIRPGARTARTGLLPVLGPDRRPRGGHSGVFPQRQPGFARVEARVPLGDLDGRHMQTLAQVADSSADGAIYLTREQNAELHWVPLESVGAVAAALTGAGLRPRGAGSLVDVQVCAGTEWCVWGVGDSRGLARAIEGSLTGIVSDEPSAEPLRVHISGCSHGCAHHQAADVGLAAVSVRDGGGPGEGFEIYGGGRLGCDPVAGRRLGKIPLAETEEEVVSLLRAYLRDRLPGEGLPEFLERTGRRAGRVDVLAGAQEDP